MNVNTLNRTVLAALIGSALAVEVSAPNSAQARQTQEESSAQQEREDARAARRKARRSRSGSGPREDLQRSAARRGFLV